MHLKIRLYNGSMQEANIDISKSALVFTLLEEVGKHFNVDPNSLDLLYLGKILTKETPLLIYKLKDHDVIGVRIKNNNNDLSPVRKCNENNNDVSISKEVAGSKYFQPGDNLYYQNPQTGQWQEASVVSVEEQTQIENCSPNAAAAISEDRFAYKIHNGETNEDLTLPIRNLLPCGAVELNAEELQENMVVLAYTELPSGQSGWYKIEITKIEKGRLKFPKVLGTVIVSPDEKYKKQKIVYMHRTIEFPELLPRDEWMKLASDKSLTKPCESCQGHPTIKCKDCSCVVCAGKHDEDKQLICEECEDAYHMYCVDPPVEEIPDTDWFCQKCSHVDEDLEEKYKVAKKRKVEKAQESIKKAKTGKDWGKGLSTAAVVDKFCVVPKDHFGKIPGVPSGRLWASRIDVCSYGVHRPPVAGICGTTNCGVQSVCISGGYEGDYDEGNKFVMSGSGGRDLSNNKRTNKQSCDQTLTSSNLALAQSCYAKVDEKKGAVSKDWQKGLPIRVVRGFKLQKNSQYAPDEGYRYDGIYKVYRYYKEMVDGFAMWKFELKRDDPEPPPWTSAGMAFMREMSVGFMEGKVKTTEEKIPNSRKRKLAFVPIRAKEIVPFVLPPAVKELTKKDVRNKKKWENMKQSLNLGYPDFIKALVNEFCCVICQEVVKDPFTMECTHNTCIQCMKKWLKESKNARCPSCSREVNTSKVLVNPHLDKILNTLLPGYNPKEAPPKPLSLRTK